jgi:ABC-2 type transport system ATP-binding protein
VLLELTGVRKTYGRTPALAGLTLTLQPGQIVALLGANGAGKSTLLRTLAGVVRPDAGEVTYDGQPFSPDNLPLRRRMLFLPDFPPLFGGATVAQHIGMGLRLYEADGPESPARVVHWLRELDLLSLAEAPVESLSRGQAYKTALTVLLAVDPELWLLDEPLASGMDPRGLQVLRREARAAAQRGSTILYTTQVLEAAERFADRIAVLHQGELRVFETVESLRSSTTLNDPDGTVLSNLLQQLHDETR